MIDTLEVSIGDTTVGTLTLTTGDRSFFAFNERYLDNPIRPTLSQSFMTRGGGIDPITRPVQTRLPAFFSNLLPEGVLREYLAAKAKISSVREFPLLRLLGNDLPGAVIVTPFDTPQKQPEANLSDIHSNQTYRFSLAGIQLKFSALTKPAGGLTIPASGMGGDWIVKLPAQNFPNVPENEWSMMELARQVGIPVPETQLIKLGEVAGLPDLGVLNGDTAFAIKRFDRSHHGHRIHIEDFAQVYGIFPDNKYKNASYANILNVVWTLTGEDGLIDFIKRLTFTVLIGNGDMHLKNWSLIYPDGRTPALAPAYDFVSTIPYIPNDSLALTLADTKDMASTTLRHFEKLAAKAKVPERLTIHTAKQTAQLIREEWQQSKKNYPLPQNLLSRIDNHIARAKLR